MARHLIFDAAYSRERLFCDLHHAEIRMPRFVLLAVSREFAVLNGNAYDVARWDIAHNQPIGFELFDGLVALEKWVYAIRCLVEARQSLSRLPAEVVRVYLPCIPSHLYESLLRSGSIPVPPTSRILRHPYSYVFMLGDVAAKRTNVAWINRVIRRQRDFRRGLQTTAFTDVTFSHPD